MLYSFLHFVLKATAPTRLALRTYIAKRNNGNGNGYTWLSNEEASIMLLQRPL